MPYSPLGRGLLTGTITSDSGADGEGDNRRSSYFPRFQGDALDANLALVDKITAIAQEKGCTPGQLALAWVLAQGDDVVPIPGTKRVKYLEENVAASDVKLSDEDLAALETGRPPRRRRRRPLRRHVLDRRLSHTPTGHSIALQHAERALDAHTPYVECPLGASRRTSSARSANYYLPVTSGP